MMRQLIKRGIDIVAAALALVLLSPLLLIIAVAIGVLMGQPVLFRQLRPGYKSRPFTLRKFRTMSEARDAQGRLFPDANRLTPMGKLLRQLSLDELPQLWNVWKGEMSLVGPRPLLMEYLDRYSAEQALRHEVKPGRSGWAQVHGRYELSWPEKFALDLWYVNHWSLWLDFRILLHTAWKAIARKGISRPGHATIPEFLGTERGRQ